MLSPWETNLQVGVWYHAALDQMPRRVRAAQLRMDGSALFRPRNTIRWGGEPSTAHMACLTAEFGFTP